MHGSAEGSMKMPKLFLRQCDTVGALEDLSAYHVGPPSVESLPFQPTVNPATSNRNRFISRSLKRNRGEVGTARIRNRDSPLLPAGARKNEKLNALVGHGTRQYHV